MQNAAVEEPFRQLGHVSSGEGPASPNATGWEVQERDVDGGHSPDRRSLDLCPHFWFLLLAIVEALLLSLSFASSAGGAFDLRVGTLQT